jgi:hypothetical protein
MQNITDIEQALQAWGDGHGCSEWVHDAEAGEYGRECHVWTVRTRSGVLSIRCTDLLMRRGLHERLIQELDMNQVGRLAKAGRWHVHVLTTGHEVMISLRQESALEHHR